MATPLQSIVEAGTRLWLDSIDPDLVYKYHALGATGATSNPIIVADLIRRGRFDDRLGALLGRDLDDALFGLYGIKEKEQDAVSRRPIKCPRCSEQNRHGTRFCGRCGLVLDMEAAMEVEERTQQKVQEKSKMSADVFSRLLDDPEVEELMRRKMEALKLSNEMQGTD